MTQLDIRQLADKGGTDPIAPLTVPEAVVFSNGDNLKDVIGTTDISNIGNGSITSAINQNTSNIEALSNNLQEITSSVTINTTYVNWARVFQMGKLILVSALLKAGVPDQAVILNNMPNCLFNTAGAVFYMNAADASREMSAYQMGTALQFRTVSTTTGSGGALVSLWYIKA